MGIVMHLVEKGWERDLRIDHNVTTGPCKRQQDWHRRYQISYYEPDENMPLGLCLVCFYKKNYMTSAFSLLFTGYLLEIYNVEVLQDTAICD